MEWEPPSKPAELAENRLIDAILEGIFPAGSSLPAERDLSVKLGVTRPTLREALQRLARDGWVEIRQGRPTRVRDYWKEGSLGVLGAIAGRQEHLPLDFVSNLLTVRRLLAPAYTRMAAERSPSPMIALLERLAGLEDTPASFAAADFDLHYQLTVASGNPVFTLILNGFRDLYQNMACIYFASPEARLRSRVFYADLLTSIQAGDPDQVEAFTQQVMEDSLALWEAAVHTQGGEG